MKKKKMDRYLIAAGQQHELDYVVTKMKKEGVSVTAAQVSQVIKEIGRSRRKVYANLRKNGC